MHFSDLPARIAEVRDRIAEAVRRGGHGQAVTIVAVTKTHGPAAPRAAWAAGLRDVGENKVQEALTKQAEVREPLTWHLIGHLQRNKVRHVGAFGLVHSVDSPRLADAIAAFGAARGASVPVLLQVNVSGEASKGGYAAADVAAEAERLAALPGVTVRGAMTMAPFGAPEAALRAVFAGCRAAADTLRRAGHPATEVSMGMSDDYVIAVEEGATLVRLGTTLFGARAA
jgi:hypothetical protein